MANVPLGQEYILRCSVDESVTKKKVRLTSASALRIENRESRIERRRHLRGTALDPEIREPIWVLSSV